MDDWSFIVLNLDRRTAERDGLLPSSEGALRVEDKEESLFDFRLFPAIDDEEREDRGDGDGGEEKPVDDAEPDRDGNAVEEKEETGLGAVTIGGGNCKG